MGMLLWTNRRKDGRNGDSKTDLAYSVILFFLILYKLHIVGGMPILVHK